MQPHVAAFLPDNSGSGIVVGSPATWLSSWKERGGPRLLQSLVRLSVLSGVLLTVMLAYVVWDSPPYSSAHGLGYWLGVLGGSLMLVLLLYPLRKRARSLSFLGPLRHWFKFHLAAGIFGPLIVLFHSTFHVGSINAAVALFSMLLVVASGIVGRFLYRKIHHGLYGSRATLGELQAALAAQESLLTALGERHPVAVAEIRRFTALSAGYERSPMQRILHFPLAGVQRAISRVRIRRALHAERKDADVATLLNVIDENLYARQRVAQFATYERLFSLWHVAHVPFLILLVLTGILHVVAVHAF